MAKERYLYVQKLKLVKAIILAFKRSYKSIIVLMVDGKMFRENIGIILKIILV